MKLICHLRSVALALSPVVAAMSLSAAPVAAASPPPPKSVFVMPTGPKEGRDPFFPNSSRVYDTMPGVKNVDNSSLERLKIKSIMDAGNGRIFAIINNHTFAPGDEGTVINDEGQRIIIRCLDINSRAGTVTVESHGARATLNFSDKP